LAAVGSSTGLFWSFYPMVSLAYLDYT